MTTREFFRKLINERREQISIMKEEDCNDILSLFLKDENFKDDDELIIDESIEFMAGGTLTSASLVMNFII